MTVGEYTYGQENITVHDFGEGAKLIIGKFCSIAADVNVFLGGNHRTDRITTYPFGHIHQAIFDNFNGEGHPATKGDVVIGNDVWIGRGAKILSGVTIGDGAVIAAYAIVTKNIPPFCMVAGNPAIIKSQRFYSETNQSEFNSLCEIKWWNWPIEKINEELPLLCSGNVKGFVEKHRVK